MIEESIFNSAGQMTRHFIYEGQRTLESAFENGQVAERWVREFVDGSRWVTRDWKVWNPSGQLTEHRMWNAAGRVTFRAELIGNNWLCTGHGHSEVNRWVDHIASRLPKIRW